MSVSPIRRFKTGRAGLDLLPLNIFDIDSSNWLLEKRNDPMPPLAAPGDYFVWLTPDLSDPPRPHAGVRIRAVGGATDTVLRVFAFTDADLAAAEGNALLILQEGLAWDIEAGSPEITTFAVPPERSFGMLVESGGLGFYEFHWPLGE